MTEICIITAPRASTLIYGLVRNAPPGRWLVPANVCPAIPLALAEAEAEFEFVDINPETLCLDTQLVADRIADRSQPSVSGIIYVRSYGISGPASDDLGALRAALAPRGILIDDRCLGAPETDLGALDLLGADAAIFSTGYAKVIDIGGGGYGVVAPHLTYSAPSKSLSASAFEAVVKEYQAAMDHGTAIYVAPGGGSAHRWVSGGAGPEWTDIRARIDDAAPGVFAHKDTLNLCYRSRLTAFGTLPEDSLAWRFSIRVANPKAVLRAIFDAGLFASDHYYPVTRLWGAPPAPEADLLHQSVINLFNDHHFTLSQAERTADIVAHIGIPKEPA
ncbi:hypothetical protein HFP51_08815 [Parasphingopyxis sp. CP4]|uniref:DegT/DnrJ/EryC1/StrS family aminotransferase n=1 Tax=Parasphingopyxis sp. CP4 TaxID=2724527 RepID=UPI0015A2B403|nr:DegT/DnrJ/EryC1/StrS family aminotransferase [Parasphingopyxis sp. CP4]QLC22267.1 hypothetical protein HFP51_08815 [Parasphingopyxis sp. CP4]